MFILYIYMFLIVKQILIIKICFLQFTQKGFRKKLIEWIVIHDYPFTVVEECEFKKLLELLNSSVKIPSADTVRRDLTYNFNQTKKNVRKQLQVSNFDKF